MIRHDSLRRNVVRDRECGRCGGEGQKHSAGRNPVFHAVLGHIVPILLRWNVGPASRSVNLEETNLELHFGQSLDTTVRKRVSANLASAAVFDQHGIGWASADGPILCLPID